MSDPYKSPRSASPNELRKILIGSSGSLQPLIKELQKKSAARRFYDEFKADVRFCSEAIRASFAEGWWRKLMVTLHHLNKGLSVLFSTGIVAALLGAYWWYVYPVVGKRWTAIFGLMILVVGLLVIVRFARRFHERSVQGLKDDQSELLRQAKEATKTIQEEMNQRNNFTDLWQQSKTKIVELTAERDSLKSQLDSSYKVVLEVDTVGRSAEVNLPQRSRVHFVPVPGRDQTWNALMFSADVRMRFDNRSETTRVRVNGVTAFLVIGDSQQRLNELDIVDERWNRVDFSDEHYSHIEPLSRSSYYLLTNCLYTLSSDESEQLKQGNAIMRLVMDAANQPNYCVDLAVANWDEVETSIGSAVTVLREGGCLA